MLKNYFKIAWRNLKKQAFFTFLNTIGLAVGMAGSLLICLYIYDELNHDSMFADADRIHRINLDFKFGGKVGENAEVSAPMAATLEKDVPTVELTTRFRNSYGMLVRADDSEMNVKESKTTFVDPTFFEMFGLDLLQGDVETALNEPNTLILSKTAAEKHFGLNDAIGQTLLLNNTDTYIVTGVIDDLPENSILRGFSLFMAMSGNANSKQPNWATTNFPTFIKLIPGANIKDFQEPLAEFRGKYVMPFVQTLIPGITEEGFLASGNYYDLSTINIQDIHLHSNRTSELSYNGSMQNVYILSFIALFLILLASVNFMNLSTANSLTRANEVGIRKTLGSSKMELIGQFLSESALITFISLMIALVLGSLALPFFNELAGKTISIPFNNPLFWGVLVISTLLLGFFSGIYPAFFLSRFRPVEVLKGGGKTNSGGVNMRSSLVVFQFAISVFLIVSTLVVYKQLNFIQSKELGYSKNQVLIVDDVGLMGKNAASFKLQVQQLASVQSTSLSSFFPTPSYRSNGSFFEEGSMEQDKAIQMQQWRVDYDYMTTIDLELIVGRDFDKQYSSDVDGIIINESAVAILGVTPEEAIGKRLTDDLGSENPRFYTVVGVVKNFHYESLRENIGALSMRISDSSNALAVKISGGNYPETIASVEKLWNEQAPGELFNYYFLEDSFNTVYDAEQRLGSIFIIFTMLSILIACLGLFGLATFNAERRAKEIGVRKILGASVSQITFKLSVDFLKLVIVGIIISTPIAYYAMGKWLEDFEYRIDIGLGVFILAIGLALMVSLITVSYQSIKAAIANPINSLRME